MKDLPSPTRSTNGQLPLRASNDRIAALLEAADWTHNPLGLPEFWPPSLRIPFELARTMPFPVAIGWGPELSMLFNEAYLPTLDGEAKQVLGAPFFSYWRDRRPELESTIQRVLNGETMQLSAVGIRYGRSFGENTFNITYSPLRDDQGQIRGFFGMGNDVTHVLEAERRFAVERERLEAAYVENTRELKQSRTFLDSLFENLPTMVFVKEARDLRFVRFNRAGEELLGYDRSELIGKNDFDFFPVDQADAFVAKDREVLAGRTAVDIPDEPIHTALRGTRHLHTRKIPIFGVDGSPEYLLGISDDVTEKLQSEQERLRLSREEAALLEREQANRRVSLLADASVALATSLDFHATLQKLADLIVPAFGDWCTVTVHESDGTYNRVAARHRDDTKAPLIEELKKTFTESGTPIRATIRVIQTGVSETNPIFTEELMVQTAQSPRHLELMRLLGVHSNMVIPIRGREKVHGAIGIVSGESGRVYNQEDLRTAEELGRRAGNAIDNALLYLEAQQAITSRDAFLSIASHELKTPLTSLTIQAQLRRRHLDRENAEAFTVDKLRRMVDSDTRQLDRLSRLIDDMLDISRVNCGKLTIHPEPVNLLQLVQEVTERHQEQFTRAGSELSITGVDHVVGMWDRYRIEQVVTNLLTNALKYGGGRPVQILVAENGNTAQLTVRDNGIGIAVQDQERIFRQFERATGAGDASGLGLGLYIVKQILDLHGGSVRVTSEPGEGSQFIVTLPAT